MVLWYLLVHPHRFKAFVYSSDHRKRGYLKHVVAESRKAGCRILHGVCNCSAELQERRTVPTGEI